MVSWVLLFVAAFALAVLGQDVPFLLDGAFDSATADGDSFNTGGTISLNGWIVTIPKNLMVTFPAAFVPWKEFVEGQDAVKGYEINVAGNIVNGKPIAAQVYMAEFALEFNQGYIEALSFDGSMKIMNGPVVRINDPNAVFSAGFSAPFLVADDQSPSITSFSGFPMCVPRSDSDELCPQSNRPSVGGNLQRIFAAPDPLVMAPFKVGDFIQYVGFKARNGEIIAYSVVAMNVQITTSGAPTYIRVEEALIGVYTSNPNYEIAETRFVGYTSDPDATVSISAVDIDSCTGRTTDRAIGVGQLRPEAGGRNKWIARIDGTQSVAYTREYRIVASTGTVKTKNGIIAGQYVQPVTEWIQPEQLVPGTEPIPHEFSQFTHLTKGVGPDEQGRRFGPLEPFPQSGVEVFDISTCPVVDPSAPQTPEAAVAGSISLGTSGSTASVSGQLFVRSDDVFVLWASQENPAAVFQNDTLLYSWRLESGSVGTKSNLAQFDSSVDNKTVTVAFAAGAPTGDYIFQLAIKSQAQNTTGTATIKVTLFTGSDTVTVQAVTWTSSQSGTIGVVCASNYLVDSKVGMSVTYPADSGTNTAAMSPTPQGSGSWSFSSRRVNQPGTVTCRSLLGGTASRTGTTAKREVEWSA